ncbi:CopY/TcrY family transcriptional regulator [Eubacterium limosum]|nr:CopY/TcrY family transcriptional regulator [Eubacterium limosum]
MNEKLPQISEAEFEVMQIIWDKAPINTNEIVGLLSGVISSIKKLLGDRLTRRYHYFIWFVLLISLCVVLLPDSLFKAVGFSIFQHCKQCRRYKKSSSRNVYGSI